MVAELGQWVVEVIDWVGYLGIFGFMFLESSFFPFPSEIVMIPAGYLAQEGYLNPFGAVVAGVAGGIAGALFNYWIGVRYGRKVVEKLIGTGKLNRLEKFFKKYGSASTFIGRLIPGIRQYISLPAGLAKMALFPFILWTGLGSAIWVTFLTGLGYFIGKNQQLILDYLHRFNSGVLIGVGIGIAGYWFYHRFFK